MQDKLDEYKKSFFETAPPEAVEVMQRATEDLKNSGILDKVLKLGQSAPEFCLPDENQLWQNFGHLQCPISRKHVVADSLFQHALMA